MKFRVLNICLAFAVALTFTSCGGGGGGSGSSSGDSSSSSGSSSSIESSIIGTWVSVCQFIGGPEPYIKATVTYQSGGQETDTVLWYMDSACSSATGLKKVNQTSYSLGNSVTASGKSAYEIDVTINSWVLTKNGSTVSTGVSVPTTYGLVAVEGNRLYASNSSSPITSSADRPTALDLDNYYTRQ
ncbi:MAG TPA: hypothetical protein ENI77_00705 [Nitrospirae bacterium]|nr:hypothetical protein [Nitrospirota bacterium]